MAAHVLKLLSSAAIEVADAELLARFVASRDEAAFTELVRRHGPLVYRVCRRLVGPSSADDAFQAVFLVLACRADRLRKPGSVGSWLVGVAGRVARQLRAREARRAGAELPDVPDQSSPEAHLLSTELARALDDELTRLPDALRAAVVACLIQGQTQDEAAAELGGSVRTLRRRLDRAKALLRLRLERRGIVPAVAAALVNGGMAGAQVVRRELIHKTVGGVSEFLAGGAVRAAPAVIAKGVVAGMITTKHWLAACAAVLGLGLAWAAVAQQDSRPGLPPPDVISFPMPMSPPAGTPALGPIPLALDFGFPIAGQPTDNARSESHRTTNFIVHAPTATMARAIAAEAEYQRAGLAKQWLGKELPPWETLCEIQFVPRTGAAGGATSFTFSTRKRDDGAQVMLDCKTELHGEFLAILTNELPHEVMHTVLYTHFGKPLPRWADEGLAVAAESANPQARHDELCREVLNAGRGVRLKVLFRMTDYPRDMTVLYAQGHSVVRFLLARPVTVGAPVLKDIPQLGKLFQTVANPHQQFIIFLHLGMDGNTAESWDKAAKAVYGFDSVDKLEEAWLEWLAKPESQLKPGRGSAPAAKPKADKPDLIPPTKLPGGRDESSPPGQPDLIRPPAVPYPAQP
jgi:RNA polymerase sigma factor (sigma-70 family)